MSQKLSVNDLSAHMYKELLNNLGESSCRKKPTIHKVLDSTRKVCPDAYEPKLISIGPLHHHKSKLKKMDHLKWKYLYDFMERSMSGTNYHFQPRMRLADFIKALWQLIQEDLMELYSVNINMEAGELVEVLVFDGCFLIELFIKRKTNTMGSPWGDATWNLPMLRRDLLLLENQIPFSVLIALFKIAFPQGSARPTHADTETPHRFGILDFAVDYISWGRAEVKDLKKEPEQIHHLLHLNHVYQLQDFEPAPRQAPSSNTPFFESTKKTIRGSLVNCFAFLLSLILMCKIPQRHASERVRSRRVISSAKNLKEAGIKFKDKKFDKCCLNISFHEESGKLEIPCLYLDQSSTSFFRNLMALEQCGLEDVPTHFTAYATFMDNIIDTAEDVEILVRNGIIEHKLGANKDVAILFNNLCKGAALNYGNQYLANLYTQVNTYCASDRHRWRATLVNNYFDNPWSGASVIAAIILLLLTLGATIATIWQTIYTVK